MAQSPQKAVTLGDLVSDRPGAPVIGEGEPPHPGPMREKAAKEKGHGRARTPPGGRVCACVCPCVGVLVFIHRMPIILSQLSPQEHSPVFTLFPESLPYLRSPSEPLTQSWVRQERKG